MEVLVRRFFSAKSKSARATISWPIVLYWYHTIWYQKPNTAKNIITTNLSPVTQDAMVFSKSKFDCPKGLEKKSTLQSQRLGPRTPQSTMGNESAASTSTSDSDLVLRNYNDELPIFFESEVKVDRLLGKGSFCMVWTVKEVELRKRHTLPNQIGREILAERMNAGSSKKKDPLLAIYGRPAKQADDPTAPPRCVVKRLRTDLYAHFDDMSRAQEDLKAELEILLKLLVKWRDQRGLGITQAFGLDQNNARNLWLERMILLSRIADAVQFLHARQIIFRDLKPDNIGVDDNGIAKLFDFGLAKELSGFNPDEHGTYKLTGSTGTPRYMPPEVALYKNYGYGVDVYSLAITMYHVLSLKSPFADVPSNLFHDLVYEKGVRPIVESTWPDGLRGLMESMWAEDPTRRPSTENVAADLSEMLRGPDEGLFPISYFSIGNWFQGK
eukprot:scaffold2383_cov161-Amphora_coffeaeformis.AAC.11